MHSFRISLKCPKPFTPRENINYPINMNDFLSLNM